MAPVALDWDIWACHSEEKTVVLDILLPNGYFLNLEARRDATLGEVKLDVWEAAQQRPLYGLLQDMDSYVFVCVSASTAEQEELVQESCRLCDARPFQAVLRLVERRGDEREKILNSQIRTLIGRGLQEYDAQKDPEVNDFRKDMKLYCEEIAAELSRKSEGESWRERLLRLKPVQVEAGPATLPDYLSSKLHQSGKLVLSVHMDHSGSKSTSKIFVNPDISPSQLLEVILSKKTHSTGVESKLDDWVLKICGLEEYLIGPYPLSQYSYIRDMISQEKVPELVLLPSHTFQRNGELTNGEAETNGPKSRSSSDKSTLTRKKKQPTVCSWSINVPFGVIVHYAHKLSNDSSSKVAVKIGLYHGDVLLCEPLDTSERSIEEGECTWEEEVRFQNLLVSNIPRSARLCVCVFELVKMPKNNRAKKLQENKQDVYTNPLAWANTPVFDFKGVQRTGPITLHMWPYEEDIDADAPLNPLGGVAANCLYQASLLTISFVKCHDSAAVLYPSLKKVMDFANGIQNGNSSCCVLPQASKSHLEQLRQICDKDTLYQLHEQEKELMWFLRADCCIHLPHSLPKLLRCVKWNDRRDVAQMTALVQTWPTIPPEKALELLDYTYADQEVRKFAVKCLQDMSDQELSLYSLQLVRALKHESYLQCDLAKFLLQRALRNLHIGHKLFWLLRSEMNFPEVSVRFGLILEAYCRGASKHLKELSRQVQALTNLKLANELVQNECNRRKESKEKLRYLLQELLNKQSYRESFQNLLNPLDPRYKFNKLRVERCKFFDSKMRPLYLVFENSDSNGKDLFIIFKNGDDLRQDMLTLQMIRIMDKMWKEEGMDFRMVPYQCLATDHKVGLIEVVKDANTIANIQKEKGFTATSAFKKGSILAWLKDHNPDEESLHKAAEEFTLSCAGYCVATYVLGVADRHSDNIMIRTNGQLFHIDFGHILGKYKEKFGIKRERVPFVLTNDFVYIITKGHNQKSQEFNRFQQYCEQAFTILRRKGPVMISLFAMMLSTGIPELSSEKDLDYLRETLVLDMTEQEALQHFRSKFDEAIRSSWKTSVNWMAHNLTKDNKNDSPRGAP